MIMAASENEVPSEKSAEPTQQKKAGLSLQLDKAQIYKEELVNTKEIHKKGPITHSTQLHTRKL